MIINDLLENLNKLFPQHFFYLYPVFVDFLKIYFINYYFSFGFNKIIKLLSFFIKNKIFIKNIDDYIEIVFENNENILFITKFPIEILGDISIIDDEYTMLITDIKRLDKVNLLYKGKIYTKFKQKIIDISNKILDLYILRFFINLNNKDFGIDDFINFEDLIILNDSKNLNYIKSLLIERYNTNIINIKKHKYNNNISVFYYVNK